MNDDPYLPPTPPAVDHAAQSKYAAQVMAMNAAAILRQIALEPIPGKHKRSGITKNKTRQSKRRRVMTRESRKMNRQKK